MPQDSDVPPVSTDGERMLTGVRHDIPESVLATDCTPPGTGDEARHDDDARSWDTTVKLADVKTRFETMTAASLRPETRADYTRYFTRFARAVDLERYTLRQLAGAKGMELLVRAWSMYPERSRVYAMAVLKKFWRRGLGLPWPLEHDDLPRPPRPRTQRAPPYDVVLRWAHAARNEPDLYVKLWVLAEINFGWRPVDQMATLRISDLVTNPAAGEPIGVYAIASEHGFKREADIVADICEEWRDALKAWLRVHPAPGGSGLMWPYRNARGSLNLNRMMDDGAIRRMREQFAKRWSLPWISSKDFRHFVRAQLTDPSARMKKLYRHRWQGHAFDPADMDETYSDRTIEEVLAGERACLPDGVLGTLIEVHDRREDTVPLALLALWRRVQSGETGPLDALDEFKGILRTVDRKDVDTVIVAP